ncbi:MAG: Formate dehydrogenase H [Chloroflexi bacterium ADurb.Bin325]|nr:MAG: Formate dehydrogenase H [Chloroflexi bacterium ADurb.Bin325]
MTNTFEDIAQQAKLLFIIGSNTTEQHPIFGMQLRQAVKQRGVPLIVADPRRIPITQFATIHLRHRPGTDTALLNGLMNVLVTEDLYDKEFVAARTEGFEELRDRLAEYTPEYVQEITGVPAEKIRQAARLMAATKPGALMYAMGITQHTSGVGNVMSCANLQMLLGNLGVPGGGVNPLRGQSNVQGACDMGGLPNVYSGYQSIALEASHKKFEAAWGAVPPADKPGLTVVEMMNAAEQGKVRAMYIFGENPMLSDPDINHVRHCLEALDFLVVQDIFMTETAQLADVVLPGASFAEKEGTFTNSERRVQPLRRALDPLGESRPDWEILAEIGARTLALTGQAKAAAEAPHGGWEYLNPAEVLDEIAALTPSYAGIRHGRLAHAPKGLQWPCPGEDHPGTPILHVGKFARGLGKLTPVDWLPPPELPDAEYPLLLTTGRVLWHYHTGTQTRRSGGLSAIAPEGYIEMHAEDAARLDVTTDDMVEVKSRRGQVNVKVEITEKVQPGVVFMTFHFAESAANLLTNASALDPVAKIPGFKVSAVRVTKLSPDGAPAGVCESC